MNRTCENQRIEVASSDNGAPASPFYSDAFTPTGVIDGERNGINWAREAAGTTIPEVSSFLEWPEIASDGTKLISQIYVFTLPDDFAVAGEAGPDAIFTAYGITNFEVQYWTSSGWATVPNGMITDNNKVLTQITFAPVVTSEIHVVVNYSLAG